MFVNVSEQRESMWLYDNIATEGQLLLHHSSGNNFLVCLTTGMLLLCYGSMLIPFNYVLFVCYVDQRFRDHEQSLGK